MPLYEVGKPFPGPFPQHEGCVMELGKDGTLWVFLQFPGCSAGERKAFDISFSEYAYYEWSLLPVAVWVFRFPSPMNPIDVNFNAKLVEREWIDNYLDSSGGVKNLVTFFLLDRNILKGMKAVGLQHEAVFLFQDTIRKQLASSYSQSEYDRALDSMFKYRTDDLFNMGVKFTHERKKK